MSGAARRRGRGRARGQADASDSSERMSVPAGGFDGPASRGSGSGTSGGRVASTGSGRGGSPQPAGGFAPQGGEARSRQSSNSGAQSQGPPLHDPALDPSRIPKATDSLKNVDLPASFFNLDRQVSQTTLSSILHIYCYTLFVSASCHPHCSGGISSTYMAGPAAQLTMMSKPNHACIHGEKFASGLMWTFVQYHPCHFP